MFTDQGREGTDKNVVKEYNNVIKTPGQSNQSWEGVLGEDIWVLEAQAGD